MVSRGILAALLVIALALCPALALGSATDPLWIGGVYDAGDWDEAVLASAFSEGVAGPAGPGDLWTSRIAVGTVECVRPAPPADGAFSAFAGRAPPLA